MRSTQLIPAVLVTASWLMMAEPAWAQQIVGRSQSYRHAVAGLPNHDPMSESLVDEHVVRVRGKAWLSLALGDVRLGKGSRLEFQSLLDGDTQTFTAEQTRKQTAYFNGDAIRVRLFAGPRTVDNAYSIEAVDASVQNVGPQNYCGPDGRTPSSDRRVARLLVRKKVGNLIVTLVYSSFLINKWDVFVTAGNTMKGALGMTAQFRVPSSTSNGAYRNPPARDQYVWRIFGGGRYESLGRGADWGVFTTFPNTENVLPGVRQGGSYFTFGSNSSSVRVYGYGIDTQKTRSFTLQAGTGSWIFSPGTEVRHRADAPYGSIGGPIVNTATGRVSGVHTHCLCTTSSSSYNVGTYYRRASFLKAVSDFNKAPAVPDLIATYFKLSATTLEANKTYTFTVQIRNKSNTDCKATTSGFYLADNKSLGGNRLIKTFNTPALKKGASYNHSVSVTMPADLKWDTTCWPNVIADSNSQIAEWDEDNNKDVGNETKCIGMPDLVPQTLNLSATNIWPGLKFSVQTLFQNIGEGPCGAFESGVYLSDDSVIDPAKDRLLAKIQHTGLNRGSKVQTGANFTIPNGLKNGDCWIGIYVDHDKKITEFKENNNARAAKVACGPAPKPDLTPASLRVSTSTWRYGTNVTVTTGIQNIGSVDSGAYEVAWVLSKDATVDMTDTVLKTAAMSSLQANGNVVHQVTVQIPRTVSPGTCWLGVIVDSSKKIDELREDNNTRSRPGTCIGRPDLVVEKLVVTPATLFGGAQVPVDVTIKNTGGAAALIFEVGIFLSKDSGISTGDDYLGSIHFLGVGAGQSVRKVGNVRIPYATRAGKCWIGVIADVKNSVAEIDDSNNTAALGKSCGPYTGNGRRIEFLDPRIDNQSGPHSTTEATFSIASGAKAAMSVTAPSNKNQVYVCFWSASSTAPLIDHLSGFTLGLLNTPLFPQWLGLLSPSGYGSPGLALPPTKLGGFVAHTWVAFFDGAGNFQGFSDNRASMTFLGK